ncbi:hypothetical protein TUM4644_25190 [Shewanella colwelliana]|nr:hypothetical protein TUM4644_25190 [Shewanella colwelliana]
MLKTLRDITQAVASADDLQSALSLLVTQTKLAMATQCCSIYILEEHELVLSATDGLDPNAIGNVKMPVTQGLVGLVAEREEPVNVADAHLHPRFKLFSEVAEDSFRAFLAVPIIYQKLIIGVLVVQQAEARQFSEAEEAFLMTLAAQLAMTVREQRKRAEVASAPNQLYYSGTTAANGVVIAHAMVLGADIPLEQPDTFASDINAEQAMLQQALSACRNTLSGLSQRFDGENEKEV